MMQLIASSICEVWCSISLRLILPRKGCLVEANSLAKHSTSTPEISAELKKFVGKKVTVSNVRLFPDESGPYK